MATADCATRWSLGAVVGARRLAAAMLLFAGWDADAAWAGAAPEPIPRLSSPVILASNADRHAPDDTLVLDAFRSVAPIAGAIPARRTELRLAHDGRTLFVWIRAFDPDPSLMVARQMRRDSEDLLSDDHVTLVIDVEGGGRDGFLFAVNPRGTQYDCLVYDGGQGRCDWDALWRSEAAIEADGWRARIEIPLSALGLRGDEGAGRTWHVNAERWMPHGSERVRLSGIRPDKEVYSLGDALPVPGIATARADWGLRLKPSARLAYESAAASGTGSVRRRFEPGLELFHQSPSGLRTTAAFNLDFGEAEADERVVNLTRFELFFPEKREFFLQDAGRFTFGGLVETSPIPFYSRRVGLDLDGRPRALDAGLKVTGTLAGTDFGAFAARVAGGPTEPGEPDQRAADVAVVRAARPIGGRNRLGLIATTGNPQGTAGSRLWGVDYQFRDTQWMDGGTLEAHGWLQRSTNDAGAAGSLSDSAYGASLDYPNLGLNGYASLQRIGEAFDPALGYLSEAGVVDSDGSIGWWHRTATGGDVIPALDWTYRRTLDGRERSVLLNPEVWFANAEGDAVMPEIFFETDRLAAAYEPVPDLAVPAGRYSWHYFYLLAETSPSRPVWASMEARSGGYYDGHRNDQTLTVTWKPDPFWGLAIGGGRNAITLPAGSFTVRMATLRLDYTPTTRLAHGLLLQWDNVSAELGLSVRLRWLWAYGRELILALDRLGYTGERSGEPPQRTRALLKLVWNLER
jgi:hypothetical protein